MRTKLLVSMPPAGSLRRIALALVAAPSTLFALRSEFTAAPKVSQACVWPLSSPRLNQRTRCCEEPWVKVSGAYHDTKIGAPSYADTSMLGKAFVKAAPERVVWGSDWPHPTVKEIAAKPDDAILFDLLADWAADERTLRKVLVENPAILYGFGRET